MVGGPAGGAHAAGDGDRLHVERLALDRPRELPDRRGRRDHTVYDLGVLDAEPARNHAAIAAPERHGRCTDGVLRAQVGDDRGPVGDRLGGGAEGEALLRAEAAQRRVGQRLEAVLSEHDQRAHLLGNLPHEPRVVDVLLNR